MSSVRLSRSLLAELHKATPRGVALSRTLETILELAGGPSRIRTHLEKADQEAGAVARVARLRALRDPSVLLPPPDQLALAEAAAHQVRSHSERGSWSYDAPSRRLVTSASSSAARGRAVTSLKDLLLRDEHQARLFVAAWATDALRRAGVPAIMVGGAALDAYLVGLLGRSEALPALWFSGDPEAVALVVGADREMVPHALTAEGFRPAHRGAFTHAAVPTIPVEVAPSHLAAREDRVVWVETDVTRALGLPGIPLEGAEELIVDYTESAMATRHPRDHARALALAHGVSPFIDTRLVVSMAHERGRDQLSGAAEAVLAGRPLDVPG